jgi:hypothetical protein
MQLGDRVVNLGFTRAPLGMRGTVVSIFPTTGYVAVVFDEEFIGGKKLSKGTPCDKQLVARGHCIVAP